MTMRVLDWNMRADLRWVFSLQFSGWVNGEPTLLGVHAAPAPAPPGAGALKFEFLCSAWDREDVVAGLRHGWPGCEVHFHEGGEWRRWGEDQPQSEEMESEEEEV